MGKTLTALDSATAMTWIKEAAFYSGELKDFSTVDIKSSFNRIWRTTVQKIDESSQEELSNGIMYKMTDVKIPTNYILTRIKSLVHYYEYKKEYIEVPFLILSNNCHHKLLPDFVHLYPL